MLEDWEREWADEALEVDPATGLRVYRRAGLVIPRKNGKTTLASALALYCGGPADGESSPHVVLAAPSKENAGELFEQATEFISHPQHGSRELSQLYIAQRQAIFCPSVRGVIKRVSADGNTNHGLNPHVVIVDELHAFKTPKQLELWRALGTAQGARRDPLLLFITTAGEDRRRSLLGKLLERVKRAADVEIEQRRPGLTCYRSRARRLLIYEYAAPAQVEEEGEMRPLRAEPRFAAFFKMANPAEHRSQARLEEDLADEFVDEPSKLRLFGNVWAASAARWIRDEEIEAARSEQDIAEPEEGEKKPKVALAVDAALFRDTAAVAMARLLPDGRVMHAGRAWGARRDVAAHEYHPGEIELEELEQYVLSLRERFRIVALAYDPRFFADTAQRLKKQGLRVVEMTQSSPVMGDATQEYYLAWKESRVLLPDGPPDDVLEAHIAATAGVATERGWKISKLSSAAEHEEGSGEERPVIDLCVAGVMAHYTATHAKGSPYAERGLVTL